MSIKANTIQLKNDVIKISEQYLNSLSPLLIQYYNNLNKNKIDDIDNKSYSSFSDSINKLYSSFSNSMIEQMENMLGDVYQSVVKFIKNTYKNTDYPIGKIEFYHKDNLTIQDRLFKWFNPTSNNFINDKITAIYYLSRILKSECRNTEEKIKHDKLWELCDYFIINNEDEDFCETVPECRFYQGLHYKNENIELPLYHPECECFIEYYGKGLGLIGVEDYDELKENN